MTQSNSAPSLPPSLPQHRRSSSSSSLSTSASTSPASSSLIQPLILTPSELESTLASIADVLRDTTTHDWTKRIAALHHLTSIALGSLPSFGVFLSHFRPLRSSLSSQILDLRSSVVKQTCTALSTIAQAAGAAFSEEADVFLPQLIRLISVSVQVIACSGDECIRTLLTFTQPRHAVQKLIEYCNSSAAITRLRCMEYTLHWLQVWSHDPEYLTKWEPTLAPFLTQKTADKTEGVRATARKALILYAELWPEQGRRLLDSLDDKVRRLIDEERGKGQPVSAGEPKGQDEVRPRSVSRKSVKPIREVLAVVDKENSHPNTAPLPISVASLKAAVKPSLPPLPPLSSVTMGLGKPQQISQPPSGAGIRSMRRTSFALQSVTAVEGDSAGGGGSTGSGLLGGAQRLLLPPPTAGPVPAGPLSSLPPRARRLSVVPYPATTLISHSAAPIPLSSQATVNASPEDSGTAHIPSPASFPVSVPSQAPPPKTAYEALLSSSVSSDLHAAIDAAFDDLHRKPRTAPSARRQSSTIPNPVPIPAAVPDAEERPREVSARSTSTSTKRKSLGALPSTSFTQPSHHPRRASMSLSLSSAESAPIPKPTSLASLLLLARDPLWSTRLSALESLTSILSSGPAGAGEVQTQFDRVVYGLVERMTDPHHKVASASLTALLALLTSLAPPASSSPLTPHLSALFPPLLLTLSHPRLGVRQQANDSLNLVAQVMSHLVLIPPLSLALTAKEGRVRRGAEEFLSYLLDIGNDEERRRKRDCIDGLVGEAGKRARALTDSTPDLPSPHPDSEEKDSPDSPSPVDRREVDPLLQEDEEITGDATEDYTEVGGDVGKPVAVEAEVVVAATPPPLPLSLLSPQHPIHQPPSLSNLLAPPLLSPPSPSPPPQSMRSLPPLSPIATEALTRFIQQQERRPAPSLAPPSTSPSLSPASAPTRPLSHNRAPSAPHPQGKSHSASKPTHRLSASSDSHARTSVSRKSASTKRLMVLSLLQ